MFVLVSFLSLCKWFSISATSQSTDSPDFLELQVVQLAVVFRDILKITLISAVLFINKKKSQGAKWSNKAGGQQPCFLPKIDKAVCASVLLW
jgi:hypothetical protein